MEHHVLLIEDEANIVEALRFLLLRDGWQVSTHSNGATAIDAVRNIKPDVIVLDVMLPHKSGFDILKDLRDDAYISDIPVLMLTARGQKKDRDTAMSLGATVFMTKPFGNTEVVQTLVDIVQTDGDMSRGAS
ncbi:MAG: response regulator [Pseudomonadota bacterium]